MATLRHIASADGFAGLGLSRRDAAWAIKALRDDALPLFAAADDHAGILWPEDEGVNANLIVAVCIRARPQGNLGATLVGCRGRVQSANGVIHIIVEQIVHLSAEPKASPA